MNIWNMGIHSVAAWGAFAASLAASLALTPLVIQFARAKGLTAKPSADRWHSKPTALFGGVAIVLAVVIAALLFLPAKRGFTGVAVGALFIFLVGLYDDRKSMRPAHKFVAQLVAACFFVGVFYGRMENQTDIWWLIPFAIVWIVGITNAFNLLDNMDGLSAGVAFIVAGLMAANAANAGDYAVAIGALTIAGATLGFLAYNFNPARIFMGDCGSMFLGFSLACLTLMNDSTLQAGNLFTALLLPTLALATPIFDTFFVSVIRLLHERPISQGGRDHTSHRLVLLGLSERGAVMWLYGITLWFGLIALWGSSTRNWWAIAAVTVLSMVALLVFALFLAEVETYSEEEYEKARARKSADKKTVLSRMIYHKRRFVEAFLDFGLICACLIAAFLLRFEGKMTPVDVRALGIAMPYVVACQMTAFYALGLYRGLWRYATISDIGIAVRGVLAGAVLSAVLILATAPIDRFPRSTLFIYTSLMLVGTVGVRLGLKALRYHFALKWREGLRRVLVVGAGDAGELAVREMFNNRALQLQPIGFLDDDPAKQRASIHGIRVLGTRSKLLQVIDEMNIDEVVIAMPSIGNGVVQEVIDTCDSRDITYREVRGILL